MENNQKQLEQFRRYLQEQERSVHTINKYLHDVRVFLLYVDKRPLTKKLSINYKEALGDKYAPTSVNSMLAAVNTYFSFIGRPELRVRPLRIQKAIFRPVEKELNRSDLPNKCQGTVRI